MKKRRIGATTLAISLLLGAGVAADAASKPKGALKAVGTLSSLALTSYDEGNWAVPDRTTVRENQAGQLEVITYGASSAPHLTIQAYDATTLDAVGSRKVVSLPDWKRWGGMYAAPDGTFYALMGRTNTKQQDSFKTIAVQRFSADWKKAGLGFVKGGVTQGIKGIYAPFDAGTAAMVLVGDRLVVHTSRLMYKTGDGVRHQADYTFQVNTKTMGTKSFQALGGAPYSSHSFSQKVIMTSGGNLVLVDHGDAYPRAIQMSVMKGFPAQREVKAYQLMKFPGGLGNNATGATVTGLASGPQGILVTGSSVRQAVKGSTWNPDEKRNAYVISSSSTGRKKVHWLTSFSPKGSKDAGSTRIVQVAPDRFVILFDVAERGQHRTIYRLVDSSGKVLSGATFTGVTYTDLMDPVLVGQRVYWVGKRVSASDRTAYLYGIDVADPTTPTLATLD